MGRISLPENKKAKSNSIKLYQTEWDELESIDSNRSKAIRKLLDHYRNRKKPLLKANKIDALIDELQNLKKSLQ